MKKKYLSLRFKKAMKVYPTVLAISLALLIVIGVFTFFTVRSLYDENNDHRVRIGLCGSIGGTYLNIGVEAIKSFDSLNLSMELVEMTLEEADRSLRSGDIYGYVIVPEGFVNGIVNYENVPLHYVMNSDNDAFSSLVIMDVARTVASLVTTSQYAVYSMESLARENHVSYVGENGEQLNLKFIDLILARDDTFSNTRLDVEENNSIFGYYICSGILLALLLWGISCSALLTKRDPSLDRLLASKGVGPFSQVTREFFVFFALTFVTFFAPCAILGACLKAADLPIPEISSGPYYGGIMFAIKAIPALLAVCAIHFLIYEVFKKGVGVILIQFFITVIAGYISGCFYHVNFFPDSVRNIASQLPWGRSLTLLKASVRGETDVLSSAILLVFAALAVGLSVFLRKREVSA